jgi:prevent-host-death family protein
MTSIGIRELKNNLSHYVRQIEAGKRVAVTAHGRVVAELVPPNSGTGRGGASRYDELVATGIIERAARADGATPEWPDIRLSSGTVAELIDSDRGEP